MISVFELFKIGIGPSSSHTVGPMKIAYEFIQKASELGFLQKCFRIKIELFGSLGATGRGHYSDRGIIWGLMGNQPQSIDVEAAQKCFEDVLKSKKIELFESKIISFDFEKDLILHSNTFLDFHSNGIKLYILNSNDEIIYQKTYYSIGGGDILDEEDIAKEKEKIDLPYVFNSATELIQLCKDNSLSISQLMMENEKSMLDKKEVKKKLLSIWQSMQECVEKGFQATGELPNSQVKRRANEVYTRLKSKDGFSMIDPLEVMDWIDLWALAVNEENACAGKVVTAPTNGAAGVIPSVMFYMNNFLTPSVKEYDETKVINFLLTAGAIGLLYQKNASISGADVGCQGEVGVACSMAAGALAEAMGGTIEQVENAAEIGMEHNLGLTCDPVGGLVQIPCIERNAMAAVKAVNAARMALNGNGKHYVSLDSVIKTMFETGKDMQEKYKETSKGGLASNVVEC